MTPMVVLGMFACAVVGVFVGAAMSLDGDGGGPYNEEMLPPDSGKVWNAGAYQELESAIRVHQSTIKRQSDYIEVLKERAAPTQKILDDIELRESRIRAMHPYVDADEEVMRRAKLMSQRWVEDYRQTDQSNASGVSAAKDSISDAIRNVKTARKCIPEGAVTEAYEQNAGSALDSLIYALERLNGWSGTQHSFHRWL